MLLTSLVFFAFARELLPRVELGTSSLPRMRSTTELKQQGRAKDGTQTRDPQLGRLVLYRLSYFRIAPRGDSLSRYRDVGADGFEPPKSKTADLQSAPFGHSGTHPFFFKDLWSL